jgi:hypothetical protein
VCFLPEAIRAWQHALTSDRARVLLQDAERRESAPLLPCPSGTARSHKLRLLPTKARDGLTTKLDALSFSVEPSTFMCLKKRSSLFLVAVLRYWRPNRAEEIR